MDWKRKIKFLIIKKVGVLTIIPDPYTDTYKETIMFTASDLSNFFGSETSYFNPMFRGINYTEGVKFISDNGAAWLVTDMLAVIKLQPQVKNQDFLCITIKRNNSRMVVVTYTDGDDKILSTQQYKMSDFPVDEVKFFYTNSMLMLASEY